MTTLVLHLGFPKTGTTTLQSALRHNHHRLLAAGIEDLDGFRFGGGRVVPGAVDNESAGERERRRSFSGSAHFARQLLLRPFDESQAALAALSRHVRATDCRYCLVSAEMLSMLPAAKVEALHDALGDLDVRIVVWLRRQAEALESRYLHALGEGYPIGHFNGYLARMARSGEYHYQRVLEAWRVFGRDNLSVRVYDADIYRRGGIVAAFLDALSLELDLEAPANGLRINARMGEHAFALVFSLVHHERGYRKPPDEVLLAGGTSYSRAMLWLLQCCRQTWPEDPPARLLSLSDEWHCRGFAAGNRRVAREYLGREDGVLFARRGRRPRLLRPRVKAVPETVLAPLAAALARMDKAPGDGEARQAIAQGVAAVAAVLPRRPLAAW